MQCIYEIPEEFRLTDYSSVIKQNYKFLSELFPVSSIELFYYLQPKDERRRLILRIKRSSAQEFRRAAEILAENLNFRILSREEAQEFLRQTPPLEEYQ